MRTQLYRAWRYVRLLFTPASYEDPNLPPDSKLAKFSKRWSMFPQVDREKWDEYRKGGGDPKY